MICKNCKKEVTKQHPNQKHCSAKCRNSYKHQRFILRHGRKKRRRYKNNLVCKICNKIFSPTNGYKQKYCSFACNGKSKRKYLNIPDCLENSHRKIDKNIGYVRIYCPMHPEANTRGYVYEHRVIAEQAIGRSLKKDEIVHHKNGIRWDNNPSNLEVMDRIEHSKLHGQREEDLQGAVAQ